MILTIDCGNTNIVMGVLNENPSSKTAELLAEWRIETKPLCSAKTLFEKATLSLREAMTTANIQFEGAIIANVVPEYQRILIQVAEQLTQTKPLTLQDKHTLLPIEIDVLSPEQVGEDRLVNVVGLGRDVELPAIIVDFGTATTLDLVLPARNGGWAIYAGGIIAPGVHRSVEALVAAAAQLEAVPIEAFDENLPILGRNTDQAMRSGIYWGYVSLISGLIDRLEQSQKYEMTVIGTGGLAPIFAPHLPKMSKIDRHLTSRGLYHIYQFNK